MKLLWCVTGASHRLAETVEAFAEAGVEVDVVFSTAGADVARQVGLHEKICSLASSVFPETDVGVSPALVTQLGGYDRIVVLPCTANTVAKLRFGIADTLITNIISQALKKNKPVTVLPTDAVSLVESPWRGGTTPIHCRDIDVENAQTLKHLGEVTVVDSPADALR